MGPFDVVLLGVVSVISSYIVAVTGLHLIAAARRSGTTLWRAAAAPFLSHFEESDRDRRFQHLEDEVRRALGIGEFDDAQERAEVLQAAAAAQEIRVLDQKLRKAVGQCLRTHWSVAAGLASVDMAEAARHPLSQHLRERVIDLSELLSSRLERYPLLLDAPELVRLQLGIRWIGPTCTTCPYRSSSIADAPRICPTGRAMGLGSTTSSKPGVVDGEVMDPCAE
jgi:hypothetical protein